MIDGKNVHAPQRFSLASRAKSFSYAFAGIGFMLRTQHNAWLHAVATAGVVALGLHVRLGPDGWRWLVVAIAMVWVAETLNTALEYVCDVVSPGFHQSVKRAKDIAAGGVLIAAVAAALIGMTVFRPYCSGAVGSHSSDVARNCAKLSATTRHAPVSCDHSTTGGSVDALVAR